MRSRRHQALRDQKATLSGAAETLLFNIGRIPVRQSRLPLLQVPNGKSCRRAEKAIATAAPRPAGTQISH
jgi:hypothetical protein